ncbi:MAG: tetratricopeptide repeat protein [Nitrospirota bacterium]
MTIRYTDGDYLESGVSHYKQGDYERAIADLTKAIEINPRNGVAYIARGKSYAGNGDKSGAIIGFIETIDKDPNHIIDLSLACFNRGFAYEEKGDWDRAIADFSQAIEIEALNAEAHFCRGTLYLNKGDYDRAITDFKETMYLLERGHDAKAIHAKAIDGLISAEAKRRGKDRAIDDAIKSARLGNKSSQDFLRAEGYNW